MSDMFTGFLSGIAAAFLNAAGYLFSAHFLKKYGSAWDLQVSAQINMLLLSLPLVWFFYPGPVVNLPEYIFYMTAWVAVFFIGQLEDCQQAGPCKPALRPPLGGWPKG